MSTRHRSPAPGLTSFAIYEDPEDQDLMSPSEMFDGDMSFTSEHALPTADDAIPSIELDEDAPQPYRSSYTSRKSSLQPRNSSAHYSVVSAIPSEASMSSNPALSASELVDTKYAPRKERPRFRNPESVRAMQMSSPPLLPTIETSRERLKGTYKLMTPSRSGRSETPVSRKSGSRRGSIREPHSPKPPPTPQQAPLVLLHVTILPPQVPYSHELMVRIMPDWLVENYKLLEEKLQDIILMRRGLLIPHPRDEYDLLEERILESLELKTPRLLKCGHFVPPEDDMDKEDDEDDDMSTLDDNTGRGSRMSGGTFTEEQEWKDGVAADASMCSDCHHELKRPGKGVGAGTRRWQIKIYAANGLMPANAWAACWNDMERCDVEISPWIPDDLRKTFEKRIIEEQEAEKRKHMYAVELQRQIQESSSKQKIAEEEEAERKRLEELELQKSFEAAAAALERSIADKAAEKKRFEEAVEEKIAEAKESIRLELEAQAHAEANLIAERLRALEDTLKEPKEAILESTSAPVDVKLPTASPLRTTDIPLNTLLKNYIIVLLKDQRNIIILVLGAIVVFLAMNMNTSSGASQVPTITAETNMLESVQTVAITTTATTTATSFSTLTVTETQTAMSMQETVLPLVNKATGKIGAPRGAVAAPMPWVESLPLPASNDQPSPIDFCPSHALFPTSRPTCAA
ncbi:hypothetical protein CC86DRAFT_465868 [Ophiobolus disseminans]|uniref:Pathway-specific nitrogen regulator n=1 Tax=Ophiobolus disseminans TaxID=1469910 RepID=A0A6A7A4N0_9PLEO|nr:hypothetical protein CC86DRAFT_465868 [Ophiobolus disseminans]